MKHACKYVFIFLSMWISLCHADAKQQDFSPQMLKDDFRELYTTLQVAHFNLFANTAKADYDRAFTQGLASITSPLSHTEAKVLFQKFAALSQTAHTQIELPTDRFSEYREAGGKAFPLFLRVRDPKNRS